MTGLDPEKETIMSIACFITDAQLNFEDKHGWEVVIHQDRDRLNNMNDWCVQTHGKSGLTAACLSSTTSPDQAAKGLLEYIQRYVPEKRKGLLAGNSVHADKAFLSKAPYNQVTDHLNYRIMDVSTVKEAVKRWAPADVLDGVPRKKLLHQAKEDILESVAEMRYYREKCFMR